MLGQRHLIKDKNIRMRKSFVFSVLLLISVITGFSESSLISVKLDSFDKTIQIDSEFLNYVEIMDKLASGYGIKLIVQQSFRTIKEKVENAIVIPAKNSNHLVGHALDLNILFDGKYYNSKLLRNYTQLPENIKIFITGCRISGIRWGGDLEINDSVHFDDRLYEINEQRYNELYNQYQEN
jgi:hypothetical protein